MSYRHQNRNQNSSEDYCSTDSDNTGNSKSYCDTETGDCNSTNNSERNCSDGRDSSRNGRHCDSGCQIRFSDSLVGVWNFIYQYDTGITGATGPITIDRPSQMLFNEGGTFSSNSTPDLRNNPFGFLLSTGVGIWKQTGERRYKLEEVHIGYRASDGNPSVYFKVNIRMKVSKKGTKALFCGYARSLDISDPTLCSETNRAEFAFNGFGYKVLQPK